MHQQKWAQALFVVPLLIGVHYTLDASHFSVTNIRQHALQRKRAVAVQKSRELAETGFVLMYSDRFEHVYDPLKEERLHFDLSTAWETFSPYFAQTIQRELGIDKASQLVAAMGRVESAYIVAAK